MSTNTWKWLGAITAFVAALGALSFCGGRQKDGETTSTYSALPLKEQNLALYDAFWERLDSDYYDPSLLATPQMRALRAEWREKAATLPHPYFAYGNIFTPLVREFPQSHVATTPPFKVEDMLTPKGTRLSAARLEELKRFMYHGAGFESPLLRRGEQQSWIVGDVEPGSLAAKAGITPGWTVVNALTSLVPKDDAVHFVGEFVPSEMPGAAPIKITYDLVARPDWKYFSSRRLPGDVMYVEFYHFLEAKLIDQVLGAIDAAGPSGLIVDLRHNVGGTPEQLQRVAMRLLGPDVYLGQMRNAKGSEDMRTFKGGRHYKGPLVVLIGPVSASAAEILAAAVQDHQRGVILGRASNGAVLVGKSFALPDGGWVNVPVYDFVRSDGRRIEGVGVEPDIRVMPTLEDVRAARDPVVERARVALREWPAR